MSQQFNGIRTKQPQPSESPDMRNHTLGTRLRTRPGIARQGDTAIGSPIMHISYFKSDDCTSGWGIVVAGGVVRALPYVAPITVEIESSADDGQIRGLSSDYATARSTSTDFSIVSTAIELGQWLAGSTYYIMRGFLLFDTSGIPDGSTIIDVKLKLALSGDNSDVDFDVYIYKYQWDNPITDVNRETNYDGALSSAPDQIWKNTAGISIETYYTSPSLDTSWINKTGFTKYALLSSRDISNIAPLGSEHIYIKSYESTTSQKPTLIIQYEP